MTDEQQAELAKIAATLPSFDRFAAIAEVPAEWLADDSWADDDTQEQSQ